MMVYGSKYELPEEQLWLSVVADTSQKTVNGFSLFLTVMKYKDSARIFD